MDCALVGVGADAGTQRSDFLFALAVRHTFLIDFHRAFVIYDVNPRQKSQEPSIGGAKPAVDYRSEECLSVEGSSWNPAPPRLGWFYNVSETTRVSLTRGFT